MALYGVRKTMRLINNFATSQKLFKESLNILAAGTNSNARLWRSKLCPTAAPCSIFIKRAKGAYIWDADDNKYIDYRLAFGPVILGHEYETVHREVQKAHKKGVIFGLTHEAEIDLTKKVQRVVPCAELVRYSSTGTEATMTAIRVARGFTGREKIIKFEGHFHGNHDYLLFSTDPPFTSKRGVPYQASLGIPKVIKELVLVAEWNNINSVERLITANKDQIAAMILEPVMGNATVIPPKKGFLQALRKLCDDHGILLIFDEVKTGFRLALGGAQEVFHVTPDIATFAKAIGNGYPISIIAGKREIIETIGPGKVSHGGTYSANPLSIAAASSTLDCLMKRNVYSHINKMGNLLMKGLSNIFTDHGQNHIMQGFPGMFQFVLTDKDVIENYRDLQGADFAAFVDLQFELLRRGVMIDEDNGEPIYLSYSHGKKEIHRTLDALDDALQFSPHH